MDFETQGWPGDGSSSNPYRIESLHITSTKDCIIIENTTMYFEISDCILDGTGSDWNYGARLYNISNGVILGCTITKDCAVYVKNAVNCNFTYNDASGSGFGISMDECLGPCLVAHNNIQVEGWNGIDAEDSEYISIINNTLSNGRQFGICLDNSHYCNVKDNTITDFRWYGLRIRDSDFAKVQNNTIKMAQQAWSEYQYSAYVHDSYNLEFTNNTILGNADVSLALDHVTPAIIENNTLDNGISITSSSTRLAHYITSNVVQGKPLYYSNGLIDSTLDGSLFGQIILVNAVNVTVNGGNFENVSSAVTINYGSNCSIESTIALGCDIYSILVQSSDRIKIRNIILSDMNGRGIYFSDSPYSEVWGCTISNGITEMNSIAGIQIGEDCDNSLIVNNEIHSIEFVGIDVSSCNNVTIMDNIITDTQRASLSIFSSENNTVFNNDFEHGILINTLWDSSEWLHNISGNDIGSKKIGYFRDINNLSIDGSEYGQIFVVHCTNISINDLITEDVIRGLVIVGSIDISAQNIKMSSLWAKEYYRYDDYPPMAILDSAFCQLRDIEILSANSGIRIHQGRNITIQDSSISTVGIAIDIIVAQNITIQSCELTNNHFGIRCQVVNTSMFYNNSIFNNEMGIYLSFCYDNVIFENRIGWNTEGNAFDNEGSNTWDNSIDTGNAWSDYSGTGSYLIPGSSASVDRYPKLLEDLPPSTTTSTTSSGTTTTTTPTSSTGSTPDNTVFFLPIAVTISIVMIVVLIVLKKRQ